jgi:hypothetical protein
MFRRIGGVLDRWGWVIAIVFLAIGFAVLHNQGVKQRHDSTRIGEQAEGLEVLSGENRLLISELETEIGRERSQAIEARDAYCRLKHYETLSGGAVLRIAAGFHLLSPRAQARWRVALERVAQIPAASSCSGAPVGLRRPSSRPGGHSLVSQGEALVSPFVGAPIVRRPLVHRRHGNSLPHHAPQPARPAPASTAPVPAPGSPPASTPTITASDQPPEAPVLNPAGHAPPGLQPGHKGHGHE